MKLSRGFATALLLALAGALVAHASVITLTQSNFNQVVGSSDFIAVEFFAPWCGHCKRLEPEWKSAAETFANDPPEELAVEVKLAAVDATAETGLATKYGVRGYPTIKIFRKGNVNDAQEYAGPRDAAGIVQYLTSLAGPASLKVSSAAEAEKLIDKHAVVVFAVGTAALEAHNIVADDLRSGPYKFAHVDSHAQLPKNMNHGGAPIVVVRSFDDPVVTFSGPFDDAEVLSNFVQDAAIPALVMLSPDPIYGTTAAYEGPPACACQCLCLAGSVRLACDSPVPSPERPHPALPQLHSISLSPPPLMSRRGPAAARLRQHQPQDHRLHG